VQTPSDYVPIYREVSGEVSSEVSGSVPGDHVPIYREVSGRTVSWNSEQMSTDEFDVESTSNFIDDDDEYDDDDDEEGTWTSSDSADDRRPLPSNVSSPRGKEFAGYYAHFDDGQQFDEDEYETTFIEPGMHYGDNVQVVEQVISCHPSYISRITIHHIHIRTPVVKPV